MQKSTITLVSLAALTIPSATWASGVSVQTFNQATSSMFETTESGFLDRGPFGTKTGRYDLNLGAHYNFVDNALVEYDKNSGEKTAVLVDGIHTLQAAIGIQTSRWAANLVIQTHQVKLHEGGYENAFGDSKLQGKYEVARSEDSTRAVVVIPELFLPTGSTDLLVSSGSYGFGIRGAISQDFGRFTGAANLGFAAFDKGSYREIDYRRQVRYSLAAYVPIIPMVAVNAEFFQTLTFPMNSQNPGELYVGSKLNLGPEIIGNAGASFGQFDFGKSNDLRIHLGVQIRLNQDSENSPTEKRVPASY